MDKRNTKIQDHTVLCCNVCAKEIQRVNEIAVEDVFEVEKEWGYFSKYDLEIHKFNICEDCYDTLIASFKIPISKKIKTEVL